jgi:hypothetical protein
MVVNLVLLGALLVPFLRGILALPAQINFISVHRAASLALFLVLTVMGPLLVSAVKMASFLFLAHKLVPHVL